MDEPIPMAGGPDETGDRSSRRRAWAWIAIGVVVAAGVCVRVIALARESLWIDEAYSIAVARHSWHDLVTPGGYDDVHPPLFFLVLKSSLEALGPLGASIEVAARLPALLPSLVFIGVVAWAGRLLCDRVTALYAAGFVGASAFAVWYADESRMYSLALGLVTLQVCSGVRIVDGRRRIRDWAAFVGLGILAALTHWYSVFSMPAVAAYDMLRRPTASERIQAGLGWVVALAVIAASVAPLLIPKLDRGGEMGGEAGIESLLFAGWSFLAGFGIGPSILELHLGDPLRVLADEWIPVGLASGALLMVVGLALRALWQRAPWDVNAFLATWLVLGFLGPFGLAVATGRLMNPRHCFAAFVPLMLVLAMGARRSGRGGLLLLAVFVGVQGWSVGNSLFDPRYGKEDFRGVAKYLEEHPRARGRLVASYAALDTLRPYGIEGWELYAYPHWRPWSDRTLEALERAQRDASDLWLVTGDRWSESESRVRDFLDSRLHHVEAYVRHGLRIDRFTGRPGRGSADSRAEVEAGSPPSGPGSP